MMNNIEKTVETSTILRIAIKKARENERKKIRDGYYVTCIKPFTIETNDETIEIEPFSHWRVRPEKEVTSLKPALNISYSIQKARKRISLRTYDKDPFYKEKEIFEVSGDFLADFFIDGYISEEEYEAMKKSALLYKDLSGMQVFTFYANDYLEKSIIAGADSIKELYSKLNEKGYRYICYLDENAKEHRWNIETGKELVFAEDV